MKSRQLNTIHDVIVTDYSIRKIGPSEYLHSFRPKTTGTQYVFVANSSALVVEGERYNIGYFVDDSGNNVIDVSALSLTSDVNPTLSYLAAQNFSLGIAVSNRDKNDSRVSHQGSLGYYWGKKYAWRQYGLCISRDAFDSYLSEINHPSIPCVTQDPDLPYSNVQSTAYLDSGLEEAISDLIATAERSGNRYFKSPRYSRKFSIRGLSAITDKK